MSEGLGLAQALAILATLLWLRVLRAEAADVALGEFTRLGVLTVPAAVVVATVLLWLALRV